MAADTGPRPPLTVLFIAGAGRSGSTLLNALLGQSADVAALGELRYLWSRAVLAHRVCACGAPVHACALWAPVLARAGTQRAPATAAALDRLLRARRLLHRRAGRAGADHREVASQVTSVLGAVAEETGQHVVVDSSKRPQWGAILARLPGVDLRVVHLVRDPRATAWSWQRVKAVADGGPEHMQRIATWRSVVLWMLWNSTSRRIVESADAYRRVSYDRLVRQPDAVVNELLEWAGAAPVRCFDGRGAADLRPVHAIAGNADRFRTGRVEIRADDEWRSLMPRRERALVGLVTLPLRRRYGMSRP